MAEPVRVSLKRVLIEHEAQLQGLPDLAVFVDDIRVTTAFIEAQIKLYKKGDKTPYRTFKATYGLHLLNCCNEPVEETAEARPSERFPEKQKPFRPFKNNARRKNFKR